MPEKPGRQEFFRYPFDPRQNLLAWETSRSRMETETLPYFRQYAEQAPLMHGTSLSNATKMLRSGWIKSHALLAKEYSESVADRMAVQTDQLDIELGLDKFTFWDLGRAHTETATYGAYFIAENSLLNDGLVSFQEIADLGGIVSPEAAEDHKRAYGLTDTQIIERNKQAAENYFAGLYEGEAFREIFAEYLSGHHSDIASYFSMWHYHLDRREEAPMVHIATGRPAIRSAWQGPQLIVPEKVSIERVKSVLLADFNGIDITRQDEQRIRHLAQSHGIVVKRLTEVLKHDIARESIAAINDALRKDRPEAAIHTVLNFALNTLGNAIINATQERELLSNLSSEIIPVQENL